MANKRLIDANALAKDLELLAKHEDSFRQSVILGVVHTVKAQPTVDAEPVVHGHWVSLTECANAGVYCSVCNKKVYKEDYAWCNRKNKLRSNYCPNCGADMRERKDND